MKPILIWKQVREVVAICYILPPQHLLELMTFKKKHNIKIGTWWFYIIFQPSILFWKFVGNWDTYFVFLFYFGGELYKAHEKASSTFNRLDLGLLQELVDWGDDFFLQGTCGNLRQGRCWISWQFDGSWWWFQAFVIFIPTWGNDPIWRAYFSNGLKLPSSDGFDDLSLGIQSPSENGNGT